MIEKSTIMANPGCQRQENEASDTKAWELNLEIAHKKGPQRRGPSMEADFMMSFLAIGKAYSERMGDTLPN